MRRILRSTVVFCLAGLAWGDTSVFTDTFTRANGSLGSNWTVVDGTWAISGNTGILSSAPGWPNVYANATFTQDQYATFSTAAWSTAARTGPAVRVASSGSNFYATYCYTISGSNCTVFLLIKVTSGGSTQLASISGVSVPAGGHLTLKAVGSSSTALSVWYNGGQLGSTYTDSSSPFTTGNPGLESYNSFSSTNGVNYFDSGNVSSNSTYTPSAADAAILTDALSKAARHLPSPADMATVGDALAGMRGHIIALSDAASLADATATDKLMAASDSAAIGDSLTPSFVFADDQTIAADNFASLSLGQPLNGAWAPGWTGSGNSIYLPALVNLGILGIGQPAPGLGSSTEAARTGEVFPGNQFSRINYDCGSQSSCQVGGVVIRWVPATRSGYQCVINYGGVGGGSAALYSWSGGARSTINLNVGLTIPSAGTLELRATGTTLQCTVGGASVLAAPNYTTSAFSSGAPGLSVVSSVAAITAWQGGAISPSTPRLFGVNLQDTLTQPAYSDNPANDGSAMTYPWVSPIAIQVGGVQTWVATIKPTAAGFVSNDFAGSGAQAEYHLPNLGPAQFIQTTVLQLSSTYDVGAWFLSLGHQEVIPGFDGTTGSVDYVGYYAGAEPVNYFTGGCAAVHVEKYGGEPCTPYYHITKISVAGSSTHNQVIPVATSSILPAIGDVIRFEALPDAQGQQHLLFWVNGVLIMHTIDNDTPVATGFPGLFIDSNSSTLPFFGTVTAGNDNDYVLSGNLPFIGETSSGMHDAIALSDSVAASLVHTATPADSMTSSDALSATRIASVHYMETLSDATTVGASTALLSNRQGTGSSTVTITENVISVHVAPRGTADTAGVGDAVAIFVRTLRRRVFVIN